MSKHQDLFSERMKLYEEEFDTKLDSSKHTIIRIDGKGFSKYTKQFEQPFSTILNDIFAASADGVLGDIDNAKFAYHQSDEVSFIIPPLVDKQVFWFSGRIQKITSIIASSFSKEFNYFIPLKDAFNKEYSKYAVFDARVFQVPSLDELVNYIRWRQRDSYRNYVLKMAQFTFGKKKVFKKKCSELAPLLWNYKTTFPDNIFAYGSFILRSSELVTDVTITKNLNQTSFDDAKSFIQGLIK